MIKTNGAEIRAFWNDQPYWGEFAVDDEVITVNGDEIQAGEFNPDKLADSDKVTIDGGYVWDQTPGSDKDGSLHLFFNKWRKAQTTVYLAVEVHKDKADAVREAIKSAGGRLT
jgi:hypothetical protein